MCIPLGGNIPQFVEIQAAFCWRLQNGLNFFLRNLAALVQVSIGPFWNFYTWNLKHLRMRELQLFITTYFLQVPWHDMNLSIYWGNLFNKWSSSTIIFSTWSRDLFLKMYSFLWISHCPSVKFCYVQKSTLWLECWLFN